MEASQLLRTARRRAGLSQRALATRAGVDAATVAAVEAGRRDPSWAALVRLLDAAGLELDVQPRLPAACTHLRRYLRSSIVERVYRAVGGRVHPVHDAQLVAWRELWRLSFHGRVELTGTVAAGAWLPVVATEPQVLFSPFEGASGPPDLCAVEVLPGRPPGSALVPVGLLSQQLLAATPDVLAWGADPADRLPLRAAARLLHEAAPVDDGLRRAPAHRDPVPRRDDHQVRHTRAYGQRPLPPPADRRGWRLDGPVSLAQWLRRYGYPT